MTENGNKATERLGAHLRDAFQDTVDDGLSEQFRTLIDDNLKKGVDKTLDEGIPERFRKLLDKLSDAKGSGGAS